MNQSQYYVYGINNVNKCQKKMLQIIKRHAVYESTCVYKIQNIHNV